MLNARFASYRAVSIGAAVFVLITSIGCPLDNTIALVVSREGNRNTVEGYAYQVKLPYQVSDPIHTESQTRYASADASNCFIICFAGNLSATTRSLLSSAKRADDHCELACRQDKAGDP